MYDYYKRLKETSGDHAFNVFRRNCENGEVEGYLSNFNRWISVYIEDITKENKYAFEKEYVNTVFEITEEEVLLEMI
jgi:hypothetical protein